MAQDEWLNGSITGRTLYALGGIEQEHVKDTQGVWLSPQTLARVPVNYISVGNAVFTVLTELRKH